MLWVSIFSDIHSYLKTYFDSKDASESFYEGAMNNIKDLTVEPIYKDLFIIMVGTFNGCLHINMHCGSNLCSDCGADKRTTVTTVENDTSVLQVPISTI